MGPSTRSSARRTRSPRRERGRGIQWPRPPCTLRKLIDDRRQRGNQRQRDRRGKSRAYVSREILRRIHDVAKVERQERGQRDDGRDDSSNTPHEPCETKERGSRLRTTAQRDGDLLKGESPSAQ